MKNLIRQLLVLSCSTLLFTACGKTSSEQAKESADSSIAELKASAQTLDSMGAPSGHWSEEQFTRYEQAINSCERSANKIEELNGKDGLIVYGTWSLPRLRTQLSSARSALTAARAEKVRAAAAAVRVENIKAVERDFRAAGSPDDTWDEARLNAYIDILNRLEQITLEDIATNGQTKQAREALDALTVLRDSTKQRIREKAAQTKRPA